MLYTTVLFCFVYSDLTGLALAMVGTDQVKDAKCRE